MVASGKPFEKEEMVRERMVVIVAFCPLLNLIDFDSPR